MFGRFKAWFSALSSVGKVGVIVGASILSIGIAGAASHPTTTPKPSEPPPKVQGESTKSVPKVEKKTEQTTKPVPFETQKVDDPNLASGQEEVRQEGVDGVRTITWEVTYTDGRETGRVSVSDGVTTAPVTKIIAHGTKVANNCSPHYTGACVPIASDVDCAGGNGNGPAYTRGPVYIVDYDIYGLDRDGDGVGCE